MNTLYKIALAISFACASFAGYALVGDWRGELAIGPNKLPLIFHFGKSETGERSCTLDSPMQGAKDIPSQLSYCSTDSVALTINSIGATFTGRIHENKIDGIFSQRGYSFPLSLLPEKPICDRRPQTPKAPFPYTSADTTFLSADSTVLAATLTMPDSPLAGNPVVVMVTGSGPQNRDEELFDHRPFAVIADFLARNGVASLRYDDRGVANSKGTFSTADIDDFKADAHAAVKLLRSMGKFGKVGVIGHSEGGTIALMLAADNDVDFAVSLAGAVAKGRDIILDQNRRLLSRLDITQKQQDDAVALISRVFDDIINGKDYADIQTDDYIAENNLDVPPVILASIKQNLTAASGSYFRKLLSLDPSVWLGNINVPVFALNGSLDTQVQSGGNLAILNKCVRTAQTKEYAGLNHLFQHAVTGDMTEYERIEETISPEVLTDIVSYIRSVQ